MAAFNPKDKLIKLQGKDYLEVRWRVVWFREQHPGGAISTELIATEPTVIVRAQVTNAEGVLLAADYGTAPAAGKGTWTGRSVEKASTAAVGRALALAGYGTQFDAEDEADNLADSPVTAPRKAPPANGNPFADLPQVEPTPEQAAAHTVKWTKAQADSFNLECKRNRVDVDEALALLNVSRLREYAPGFSEAREALKRYIKARPADATPLPADLFGGNGGAA